MKKLPNLSKGIIPCGNSISLGYSNFCLELTYFAKNPIYNQKTIFQQIKYCNEK